MNKSEKLKLLQKLSEKELTLKFLIPLYESKGMGCKNVRYTHRKLEFGKDIIYSKDNEYGTETYTGVQVKRTKITTSDIDTISRQITEAFGEPFTDSTDGKKKDLDRVVVLSSNEITEEAKDSLWASLKGARLDKLVKFVDGNQLIKLLEDHLPSAFWDEYDYIQRYFNAMKKDFETIKDISAIGQKDPIPLEQMYVSLKVSEKTREREIPLEKRRKIFDEEVIQRKKEVERPTERVNIIDVDKALKDYRKFVIVGAPGSGKTTVLKHFALKSCKENLEKQERICTPVPIILLKFLESGKDLRDYIDVVFEEYDFPRAKEFVEKDLKEGKCMVLLDGFDELVSKENQEQVTVRIQEFVKRYHRCQIIVTSRVADYHDELKDFMKLELMEFDDKQIKMFIKNWFGKTEPDKAKSMQEAIENEHIKDIVRNPLMIAITAIIHEEDKRLPQKRAELYKRCVEVLLNKWDVQRRLRNKYASDKKEFILRKLAFYGHSKNKRIMTEREITEEMLKHFPRLNLKEQDAKPFLNDIWQRSSLLRQISIDSYDFLHLSFQEYFTALELKEQSDGLDIISNHLSEPWWEEPTLLYAGIKNDATDLIKKIRKELPEDIFYSNLILFGKCIVDAEHTEPSLKEEIIKDVWLLYRNAEFSSLRERAIKILALIKPEKYIDSLIKELEDKESKVRSRATESLGMMGNEKAIEPLIKILSTDKDECARLSAAAALGKIGSEKAIDSLITSITKDQDIDVRWNARWALGMIGNEKVLEGLVKVLTNYKEDEVRSNAACALGMTGSENAIVPLIKTLTTDKSGDVRKIAAEALAMIGSETVIKPIISVFITEKVMGVRGSIVYALGKIGTETVIEPLIKILTTDKEDDVRASAGSALGMIGSEKVIEPLISVLTTDKARCVREIAAEVLGDRGDERAIKPLVNALTNESESVVRWRAAEALGKIGSETAIEPLIKILTTDSESDVREKAAEALGKIGGEKIVEPLIDALINDKARGVRGRVANELGRIGGDKVTELLSNTLINDKDSVVRAFAAHALGNIGSAKVIDLLINVFAFDKEYFVQESIIEVLENIGNEKAIEPLKRVLENESAYCTKNVYGTKNVKDMAFYSLEKISRRIGKRIPLRTSKAK